MHEVPPLNSQEITAARLYAWGAFFRRPFLLESFKIDFHANSFRIPQLAMNVSMAEQFRQASAEPEDLATIADWMAATRRSDLLAAEQ